MADAKSKVQDKIVEPMKAAGEAMKDGAKKAAERSSQVGMTMIDHAEANTREAFAAMRAAAKAGNLTDVLKVQGDYLRDQSARGMAQAREIGEMIVSFGKEAMAPLTGKKD